MPVSPGELLYPTVLAYAGLVNKRHGWFGPDIRICRHFGVESMGAAAESPNSAALDWEDGLPQTEAAMSG